MIHRQGEKSLVVIISYVGYSPPKCTCHGKQSHSSKYMILLECLHAQSHVSSPNRLPHTCLSQMRVKSQLKKKKFLFLKTYYRDSVNILDYPPRRICWITLRNNSWAPPTLIVGQSPKTILRKIFRRNFLSQTFSFLFSFISCTHS